MGLLFFIITFYWSTYCVIFCWTAKWVSYTCAYIHSVLWFPSHFVTTRHWVESLSIVYIVFCICQFQSPDSIHSPNFHPLVSIGLFSMFVSILTLQISTIFPDLTNLVFLMSILHYSTLTPINIPTYISLKCENCKGIESYSLWDRSSFIHSFIHLFSIYWSSILCLLL